MKKGSSGKSLLAQKKKSCEMELDFTLSRAGLGTHKKNCAEKARLDSKIRSLDVMRRRSIQLHEDELREIQQRLAAGAGLGAGPRGSGLSTPRLGDDDSVGGELLVPGGEIPPWSYRSGRRGSLQPDPSSPFSFSSSSSSSNCQQKFESSSSMSPSSSNSNVLTLALPPTRRRRPSVVLQDLSTYPAEGRSRQGDGDSDDDDDDGFGGGGGGGSSSGGGGSVLSSRRVSPNTTPTMATETIIDLLAAGNRPPRLARRGSVGIVEAGPRPGPWEGPRADAGAPGTAGGAGLRRGRRADGAAGEASAVAVGVGGGGDTTNFSGDSLRAGQGAERRPSVGEESGSGSSGGAGGAERKGPGPLPFRGRRASLDVGVANLSLLSPPCRSPGGNPSRLNLRRSSCASSQGTDLSSPSTPDSKSRDSSTVFTFPPVTPVTSNYNNSNSYSYVTTTTTNNNNNNPTSTAWCTPRPAHDSKSRLQLQRSHSSDGLTLSPTSPTSRRNFVSPAAAGGSSSRHRRNSSLKLPRMQGGSRGGGGGVRKSAVTPCVNRMVLLHSVMQNSSIFQSADPEEGRL